MTVAELMAVLTLMSADAEIVILDHKTDLAHGVLDASACGTTCLLAIHRDISTYAVNEIQTTDAEAIELGKYRDAIEVRHPHEPG